ncbi:hypothetical protein COBT_002955 [Conglomerata obtusa]
MEKINRDIQSISLEKTDKKKKEKAKLICYDILNQIKLNTSDNNPELKEILLTLIDYCESLDKKIPYTVNKPKNNQQQSKGKNVTSKEHLIENTLVKVIGMERFESIFEDAIELPIKHPELFTGKRKPPKTILLYGPPGTGKTHIIESLRKYNIKMIKVTASDLFSKYQGDSEKQIKKLFEEAFLNKPSLIFIDEIDFLCSSRTDNSSDSINRIKSELLIRFNEIENNLNVYFVGATNFPWSIDNAFIRRFSKRIFIGLPDFRTRKELLKFFLEDKNVEFLDEDFNEIANFTHLFSSSDIKQLCERILCEALQDLKKANCFYKENNLWKICQSCILLKKCENDKRFLYKKNYKEIQEPFENLKVNIKHFHKIKALSKSSTNNEMLLKYDEWTKKFGE